MTKRLLLVEHHDHLRTLLSGFLAPHFDVTGAKDGVEALAWLNTGLRPAAIVAGSRLNHISSQQLIATLHDSGLHRDIPVVVLGDAAPDSPDAEQFRRLGARDYLPKPFDPLRLHRRLAELTAAPEASQRPDPQGPGVG